MNLRAAGALLLSLVACRSAGCGAAARARRSTPIGSSDDGRPTDARSAGAGAYPWIPDQADGSYRNPIIFADYSDPDVIRVADRYYLVASSFTSTPALPILRSSDLVNWTIVGHAMDNLPGERYADFQAGAGVWAPAMRQHAGIFYLFAPLPDEGIYVMTATAPEGPWTAPRLLVAGRGLIDPCPLWDDDGRAYLVHAYARSRAGIKDRLRLRPMAPDASRLLGEGTIVFSDPVRHPTLEGPKLYKRNGWYYILAPAGGVSRGWQVALRSRRIDGPYQDRIVLAQGRTSVNGPHQGALVDTPGGQWWFVHFQDAGVSGRIVHLNPVTWQDDWPLMGAAAAAPTDGVGREPVLRHAKPDSRAPSTIAIPQTSDELDAGMPGGDGHLAPQWQWHANHRDDWYDLRARPGWLRLRALPLPARGLVAAPQLLLQKLPARTFAAETSVELTGDDASSAGFAGLVVVGESAAALVVESTGTAGAGVTGRRVSLRIDGKVVFATPVRRGPVRLAVTMDEGGRCRFAFASGPAALHAIDAPFAATAGRWVGAEIGVFAAADADATPSASAKRVASADFDYFRFSAPVTTLR